MPKEEKWVEDRHPGISGMDVARAFSGGLAHDLNNIFTGILGFTSLLMMEAKEDDPLCRYCREIEKSAADATTLIDKLVSINRQETILLTQVDIKRLMLDTVDKLTRDLKDRPDISVEINDLPAISLDGPKTGMALELILYRAAKCSREGGRIAVSAGTIERVEGTSSAARNIIISIICKGSKVPGEKVPFLTEPVYTSWRDRLLGFEMAIARDILAKQGFILKVENGKTEEDLVFSVTGPCQQ